MKKKQSVDKNHINEMLHRIKYVVNETPRYKAVMGEDEIYDHPPTELYNTDSGMPVPTSPAFTNEVDEVPAPESGPKDPTATDPSTEAPILDDPNAAKPPQGGTGEPQPPSDPNAPPTDMPTPPNPEMGMGEPIAPKVDDIQNDIIKHNIAAMQAIHDQLISLNATVDGLNQKMVLLNADVEEVREPTNTEKLMNKTQVSYPYYFNLNDVWGDNWFNQRRAEEGDRGMRQLEDGTYVADFDDLPQHSKIDVEKSFNDMV